MNFYSIIIGSELLNGRRQDSHFEFVNSELIKRGWLHKASFIIKDDFELIKNSFEMVKNDKNSVLFSFGGIGSTPDDITRAVSAEVFGDGKLYTHEEAERLILNRFGDKAYPHRIRMSELPKNAKLLKNVVNDIPAFQLENRFFFTPGFPSMSHPMIREVLDKFYPKKEEAQFRRGFIAFTSENDFINLMKQVPPSIELSSLPSIISKDKREVEISLLGNSLEDIESELKKFIDFMKKQNIKFKNKG